MTIEEQLNVYGPELNLQDFAEQEKRFILNQRDITQF